MKTKDGIVWLNRSQGGEIISVPFSKMSKADRDYVANKSQEEAVAFLPFPPLLSDNG